MSRLGLVIGLLVTLAWASCSSSGGRGRVGDASSQNVVAASDTDNEQPSTSSDVTETPCEPACSTAVCGPDGCGGSCGTCNASAPFCQSGQCVTDCTPDCSGKECGDDGCGGDCGACPEAAPVCNAQNKCEVACTPACDGMECGEDGCGGTCGTCPIAAPECVEGLCQLACTPSCDDKECGDDGCGGSCGTCAENAVCEAGQCASLCTPSCAGKECGDDGCGGKCGSCGTGVCEGGTCVAGCDTDSMSLCDCLVELCGTTIPLCQVMSLDDDDCWLAIFQHAVEYGCTGECEWALPQPEFGGLDAFCMSDQCASAREEAGEALPNFCGGCL